jgi:hypothetical protein
MARQHAAKCRRDRYPFDRTRSCGILSPLMRSCRAIIAGLLAFWLPLCCCQIAAIAGTGAPCCAAADRLSALPDAAGCCATNTTPPSCCGATAPATMCCGASAPTGTCCVSGDQDSDTCEDSDCEGGSTSSSTCMCCATKAPVPEQDPVDPILSAHEAADAIPASMLASSASAAPLLACNGPPDGGFGAPRTSAPWPCGHATERCAQLSCWTE